MMGATPTTDEKSVVESPPGASSHKAGNWHTIRWHEVERNVKRLQARIVQATQQGRWGKVKALQHLLACPVMKAALPGSSFSLSFLT